MEGVGGGAAQVKAESFHCPNCGGTVQLRGYAHTLTVVCTQCLTILDASTPLLRIMQKAQTKQRIHPLIPLGTRGKLQGVEYEVIGFQVRESREDEETDAWSEYLLFNPYRGFRYLSEYKGHWNEIAVLRFLPEPSLKGTKLAFSVQGERFLAFQTCTAHTTYVLGEFPWRVLAGDHAEVSDFIAPPRMLSSEKTGENSEVTWSLGEYRTGAQIWEMFHLPGRPPSAIGVYENQPSPMTGKVGSAWRTLVWMLVILSGLMVFFTVFSRREGVFRNTYYFSPGAPTEASYVSPVFDLKGRPSNVELSIKTNLDNNWAYFSFALINEANGQAYDFGRQVSYYHGRDSDGNWSEGSPRDSMVIPTVPSGRYYLRVEPEMETKTTVPGMSYTLTVRRDVPSYSFFGIAALLLAIPPIIVTWRAFGFERVRWQQSSLAGGSATSSESSDD